MSFALMTLVEEILMGEVYFRLLVEGSSPFVV